VLVRPPSQELCELGLDLPGALREEREVLLRDPADVGLAGSGLERVPHHPETAAQLGAQRCVVQPADRPLLPKEEGSVESEPGPGAVLDLGGPRVTLQIGQIGTRVSRCGIRAAARQIRQ
jgi:hypothetical protein